MSEAGLWRTDDLGASWRKLAPGDQEQIRYRPHQIVFDPAEPRRFWISGCYDASPSTTADGGKTFQRPGNLTHLDGIAVGFTDPQPKTFVAGLHEQARSVHKSTDGGKTWQKIGDGLPEDGNHSTDPILIDARRFIINTAGVALGFLRPTPRRRRGKVTRWSASELCCASASRPAGGGIPPPALG